MIQFLIATSFLCFEGVTVVHEASRQLLVKYGTVQELEVENIADLLNPLLLFGRLLTTPKDDVLERAAEDREEST